MPREPNAETITPAQCRAGRALLGISQTELAQLAEVGLSTVVNFEKQRAEVRAKNLADMIAALEAAGVIFLEPAVDHGPGVALALKPKRKRDE